MTNAITSFHGLFLTALTEACERFAKNRLLVYNKLSYLMFTWSLYYNTRMSEYKHKITTQDKTLTTCRGCA